MTTALPSLGLSFRRGPKDVLAVFSLVFVGLVSLLPCLVYSIGQVRRQARIDRAVKAYTRADRCRYNDWAQDMERQRHQRLDTPPY